MGRSFFPASDSAIIEQFDQGFAHEESRQHFEMVQRDGKYMFRRFQVADDGQPINVFEQPVDWVLGSGHNSRTYLYQTPAGELYQLPIAWYSQEQRWGMAPGFDRADHEGVTRRVRRECLFCHNAYPDVPDHSDSYGASQTFPRELPHGIGCQRCHGAGADHVRVNLAGPATGSGIVNPGKLTASLRDDVCNQCHLQPSVVLFGIRRFGRGDYSFRPGEPLADYIVPLDIVDENQSVDDRFEINHHPYRLQQSQCFIKSGSQLNCLTCHDPHQVVPSAQRSDHYRIACQKCHSDVACQRPDRPSSFDVADCVQCHMPRRRTQDVVHVVATDHKITRIAAAEETRLAPLKELEPILADVVLSKGDRGTERGEIYRATAVLQVTNGRHAGAANQLTKLLSRLNVDAIEPRLQLARAHVALGQGSVAVDILDPVIKQYPSNAFAHEIQGLAQLQMGTLSAAESSFQASLKLDPLRPVPAFSLGRLELTRNNPDRAVEQLESVAKNHPTLAGAWYHLGEAHALLEKWQDAAKAYQLALEIDPNLKEAYFGIERALKELGRVDEAARYQRHGKQLKLP